MKSPLLFLENRAEKYCLRKIFPRVIIISQPPVNSDSIGFSTDFEDEHRVDGKKQPPRELPTHSLTLFKTHFLRYSDFRHWFVAYGLSSPCATKEVVLA